MRFKILIMLLLTALLYTGCSVGYMSQGRYYLDREQYKQGRAIFEENVRKNPENAVANYYLGRFYLTEGQSRKGLLYLQRSAELDPRQADTYFWIGVAHSQLNQAEKERESYQKALSMNNSHIQARTYLAHNQLENGQMQAALSNYEKVLLVEPENPDALYNRAVIYSRKGSKTQEREALKRYLYYYPSGAFARQAVSRLNQTGDFEYRNYIIGPRTVSLKQIRFLDGNSEIAPESKPSLDVLGAILTNNPEITINIIVYQNKNKKLAEPRAKNIKYYLLSHFPAVAANRLKPSWFTMPEVIRTYGNSAHKLDEAVNFFSANG